MNFKEFVSKFTISIKGDWRNKLCYNQKNHFVTIFYLKIHSSRSSKNYYKYYKYNLINFKPWIGSKYNIYGGEENSN